MELVDKAMDARRRQCDSVRFALAPFTITTPSAVSVRPAEPITSQKENRFTLDWDFAMESLTLDLQWAE